MLLQGFEHVYKLLLRDLINFKVGRDLLYIELSDSDGEILPNCHIDWIDSSEGVCVNFEVGELVINVESGGFALEQKQQSWQH